jgi:hypothetical protein
MDWADLFDLVKFTQSNKKKVGQVGLLGVHGFQYSNFQNKLYSSLLFQTTNDYCSLYRTQSGHVHP